VSPRPSRTTTGSLTLLIFNPTEDHQTSDALLPTQDGGNCSDLKADLSSTRKERSLKFKTKDSILIPRTETSKLLTEEMISDNNGTSSMLMNTKNQRREK
jgi:hypothetical protein